MGRGQGWAAARTGRAPMRSPGRPRVSQREHRRRFWEQIAKGATSEDAGMLAGVSPAVGTRWFGEAGGMPPSDFAAASGRYLSFGEREEIALLRVQGVGVNEIGRRLGRSASTISRELRRNAATRGGKLEYRAVNAQWHRDRRAARPRKSKLEKAERLREYVQERLAGMVRLPDGRPVAGPQASEWKGRNKGRRQDRRWALAWSPEQIANRLPIDFPDDESMRISHEAIYQALFIKARGGLERELVTCLRTGRALRVPRARSRARNPGHVTPETKISARPVEAGDRAVAGHWEGDLVIGTDHSAVGTLVERTSRFAMLLHLPREDGYGTMQRVKNGPALAGHGAAAVRKAVASTMGALPEELRRTLTWDRGKELAQHAQLTAETGIGVFFADPHSPWQRGTNENFNGLLRQYLPKGTDLSRWGRSELDAIVAAVNNRPRKILGWRTPAEVLKEHIDSRKKPGVARTG